MQEDSKVEIQKQMRDIFLTENLIKFEKEVGFVLKGHENKLLTKTGVCGKIIRAGEIVYHCQDCAQDHATFICVECFEHGNHQGHNFQIVRNPEKVMCDCGDIEALDSTGFCSKHTGVIEEKLFD